eukprot:7141704-Prymnesium_polylepis.1
MVAIPIGGSERWRVCTTEGVRPSLTSWLSWGRCAVGSNGVCLGGVWGGESSRAGGWPPLAGRQCVCGWWALAAQVLAVWGTGASSVGH